VTARWGALAAALGAGGLAAVSVAQWFAFDIGQACGWTCYSPSGRAEGHAEHLLWSVDPATAYDGLGPLAAVALVVCALAALAAAVLVLAGRRPPLALPVLALLGATGVAVRVVTQPGLGRGEPNRLVDVTPAAWVGMGCAVLAAAGVAVAWRASRLESAVA
jgi:hypothetical protein